MIGTVCLYQTEERLKQLANQHLIARDAPKVVEGESAPAAPDTTEHKPEAK